MRRSEEAARPPPYNHVETEYAEPSMKNAALLEERLKLRG
jgi:hypothetical protein